MKKVIFSLSLVFTFLFAACQQPGGGKLVNETVALDKFDHLLSEKSNAIILDVRTPQEFVGGHISGAVNLDIYDNGFKDALGKLDKSRPVLVYCKSGGRSESAMKMMGQMGFNEVYNLQGGMLAWSNAGKPVDNGGAAPKAAGMTEADYLKKVAEHPLTIVDFNAVWCGPCKKMMPIIEKIVADQGGKLTLLKVDADENPELMRAKKIDGIPYFELYKDGKLIWSQMGMTDEATIVAQLK